MLEPLGSFRGQGGTSAEEGSKDIDAGNALQRLHPAVSPVKIGPEGYGAVILQEESFVFVEVGDDGFSHRRGSGYGKRDEGDRPENDSRLWRDVIGDGFPREGESGGIGGMSMDHGEAIGAVAIDAGVEVPFARRVFPLEGTPLEVGEDDIVYGEVGFDFTGGGNQEPFLAEPAGDIAFGGPDEPPSPESSGNSADVSAEFQFGHR